MGPQKQNRVHVEQGVCPNCGYCPHCGRVNAQPPYAWPYAVPPWNAPYIITCGSQTQANPSGQWNAPPFVTGLSVAA